MPISMEVRIEIIPYAGNLSIRELERRLTTMVGNAIKEQDTPVIDISVQVDLIRDEIRLFMFFQEREVHVTSEQNVSSSVPGPRLPIFNVRHSDRPFT